MRVLVAGGAGFLGGSLCGRLLERGDEVVCLDNLITGTADNVKPHADRAAFAFVDADVSAPLRLDGSFGAIVNLACPASPADFDSLALEVSGSTSGIAFAPRPADDPSVRRPDLTVARRELGWEPATPFREGLARTIDWFARRSAP